MLCENNRDHLTDFVRLNEEWISTYFELEDVDHALAGNPGQIIDDGGYIFSLMVNDEVVGACALFYEGDGVYEIARMAVSPKHQGKGYGESLMQACLQKLADLQARKAYIVSNTKLESAIALYKKHDFKVVHSGEHPGYSRANIVMERYVFTGLID